MSELLKEAVKLILLERENDAKFQRVATNSFISVSSYLRGLQEQGVRALTRAFGKDESKRNTWLSLNDIAPRPEHEGLYLFFVDRKIAGVKPTLTALASRFGKQPNREYRITIYVDSDAETVREWNKDLATHVVEWFDSARKNYIHEFVHTLDFRRMSDEYLAQRTSAKRQAREQGQTKDFAKYMNDPMESNAYTHESFADVASKLRRVRTLAQFDALMGATPNAFVDIFMSEYLDKRARKHWTEENKRKVIKRAVEFYRRARERFEAKTG